MDNAPPELFQLAEIVVRLCIVGLIVVGADYFLFGPSSDGDDSNGDKRK